MIHQLENATCSSYKELIDKIYVASTESGMMRSVRWNGKRNKPWYDIECCKAKKGM